MASERNKKTRRFFGIAAIIVIILVIVAVVAVNALLNKINRANLSESEWVPPEEETFEATAEGPDTLGADEVVFDVDKIGMMEDNDIKNLLLIGQDRREGEDRQRSDSMIICSINSRDNKITLVSLMRDMYVPIPGYSANRINAAYSFGGMELLDQTVEQAFGIPIHGNVEVDFDGFMESLEIIGDLEIELTEEEAAYMNNGDWFDMDFDDTEEWHLTGGYNRLTPPQALAFSRMRFVGNSDWDRTDRQRRVIMSAFAEIGNSNTATMLKLADDIFPHLTTDMSNGELLSYVKTIGVIGIHDLESYRLPVEGYYTSETINGMSVLVPDLVMNSEYVKEYIYGDEVDEELMRLPHAEGEGASGAVPEEEAQG